MENEEKIAELASAMIAKFGNRAGEVVQKQIELADDRADSIAQTWMAVAKAIEGLAAHRKD